MTILRQPMFWKRLKIDDSCSQIVRKRGMRRPDRDYSCYRGFTGRGPQHFFYPRSSDCANLGIYKARQAICKYHIMR